MRIVIEAELSPVWATDEELEQMTDKEIIELVNEDVSFLLDGASWTVRR